MRGIHTSQSHSPPPQTPMEGAQPVAAMPPPQPPLPVGWGGLSREGGGLTPPHPVRAATEMGGDVDTTTTPQTSHPPADTRPPRSQCGGVTPPYLPPLLWGASPDPLHPNLWGGRTLVPLRNPLKWNPRRLWGGSSPGAPLPTPGPMEELDPAPEGGAWLRSPHPTWGSGPWEALGYFGWGICERSWAPPDPLAEGLGGTGPP